MCLRTGCAKGALRDKSVRTLERHSIFFFFANLKSNFLLVFISRSFFLFEQFFLEDRRIRIDTVLCFLCFFLLVTRYVKVRGQNSSFNRAYTRHCTRRTRCVSRKFDRVVRKILAKANRAIDEYWPVIKKTSCDFRYVRERVKYSNTNSPVRYISGKRSP